MSMTREEKAIIMGSAAVISISVLVMCRMTKKYNEDADEIITEIRDIHYELSKSREDIIVGNKEISEGNKLLKKIVKQTATSTSNAAPTAPTEEPTKGWCNNEK